jgi:ABC-type transport system involved in cytochrome c biogenesis permease component
MVVPSPRIAIEILGSAVLIPVVEIAIALLLHPEGEETLSVGATAIWLSLLVNSTTLLPLILREPLEDHAYELEILARKTDRFFLRTTLTGAFFLWMFGIISLLVASILFNLPLSKLGAREILTLGLYSLGHTSLSFLLYWMTARVRGGFILLPLLGYPFYLPLIVAGVQIYRRGLGLDAGDHPWFLLLTFVVLFYIFFGLLLCPYLLRE